MKRKIANMTCAACEQGLFVYAVATDGTVWVLDWISSNKATWEKPPDLPSATDGTEDEGEGMP